MKTLIVMSLVLAAGVANAGERIKGNELKSFWNDKTIVGKHHRLGDIKTYHGADGVVISQSASGVERRGKWWISKSGDRKCIKWSNSNKKRCHYTEKNSDGSYTLIHGKKGKKLVEISSTLDGNQL